MRKAIVIAVFIVSYGLFINDTLSQEFNFTSKDLWAITGFALLYIFLSLFPIPLKRTSLTFTNAISLAVFLLYGFHVEAWLMQFSIIVTLSVLRSKLWRRYYVNMLMFLIVSYFSAEVYYFLEGSPHYYTNLSNLPYLGIIGYILTTFFLNHSLLQIAGRIFYGKWRLYSLVDTIWEMSINLIIAPFGILLYVFYMEMGTVSILYFGVPIITFSFILKIYKEINNVNKRLRSLNQFSNRFSVLNVEESVDEIFATITHLFPCDYSYILFFDEEKQEFKPLAIFGDLSEKERRDFFSLKFNHPNRPPLEELPSLRVCKSGLTVPMIRNGHTIGFLAIFNKNQAAFLKNEAFLFRVLANQVGIALYNAHQYEKTHRNLYIDDLTGINNYRAFENQLFRRIEISQQTSTNLSLLILDIDHFKQINDTYGHLAGDQVLKQIADLLHSHFDEIGVVFRYGGEEFTVLLPGVSETEALKYGEEIRKRVQAYPIKLDTPMLEKDKNNIWLTVTVSIGIATYPTRADDAHDLVRKADRAMYIGAKEAGRNKVAILS